MAEASFTWEWLEGQTLLLQNRTQRQGQYILQELQNRGLKAQEVLESSNIRAAAALAANGYGVAFMSGELLRNLHLDTDFSAVPLRDCTLPLESVAAWRAGNYLPRYTQTFIELMGQAKALFTDLASTVIRASRGRIFVQSTARVFSKSSSKVRHANLAASTYILFAVLRNTFARATSSKPPSKKIFPFSAGEGANPSSESSRLSTASTPLAAVAHSLISPSKILMPLFYHKADGKRIF